ncbi:hypothetical protein FPQ18DRAFT_336132 [Pyronema domesticum]|nr:hypothetical protein FPQ18DRAFT_336132 [Pyronema domesticum]
MDQATNMDGDQIFVDESQQEESEQIIADDSCAGNIATDNEKDSGDSSDVKSSSDDEAGTDGDSSDHNDDVYAHSNSSDHDDVFWTDTDFSDDDDDGVTDELDDIPSSYQLPGSESLRHYNIRHALPNFETEEEFHVWVLTNLHWIHCSPLHTALRYSNWARLRSQSDDPRDGTFNIDSLHEVLDEAIDEVTRSRSLCCLIHDRADVWPWSLLH